MNMIFRWFGPGYDNVEPRQIRQIPGITGVAATLMGKQAGEAWSLAEIQALQRPLTQAGLAMEVIESVNIHDDIKLGVPEREAAIERYIHTIRNLGRCGVKVICYNFMPVFDWMRTDLWKTLPDGSRAMAYDHDALAALGTPEEIIHQYETESADFPMPGWEKERLSDIRRLFARYAGITHQALLEHLGYFLERIMPACQEAGVKMALHPDDPPWDIFGLPRVLKDAETMGEILALNDSPCHTVTFCTGSLGADAANDLPAMIRRYGSRVSFAHVRNIHRDGDKRFWETAHLTAAGFLPIYDIVKALHDYAPDCYIRPDHGRMLENETGRAGYGYLDRAFGVCYLNGLWEAIDAK